MPGSDDDDEYEDGADVDDDVDVAAEHLAPPVAAVSAKVAPPSMLLRRLLQLPSQPQDWLGCH